MYNEYTEKIRLPFDPEVKTYEDLKLLVEKKEAEKKAAEEAHDAAPIKDVSSTT